MAKLQTPYRLALKVGVQRYPKISNGQFLGSTTGSDGYVGWAMLRLPQSEPLPTIDQISPDDVEIIRVIRYASPEQMPEPMPIEEYERRAAEAVKEYPGAKIERIDFDRESYNRWLAVVRQVSKFFPDSSAARAQWVNQLEIDDHADDV